MGNAIRSFKVRGFRSLTDIGLDDLKRVNAFVGRNGAGKTSILEGLYLFFSRARLESIIGVAERRGEYDKTDVAGCWRPSMRHLFTGYSVAQGKELISLAGNDAKITFAVDTKDMPLKDDYRVVKPTTMCSVSQESNGALGEQSFPICKSGAVDVECLGDGGYCPRTLPEDMPVIFVSPDGVEPEALLKMRDEVVSRGAEGELAKVLRLIDPRVESVGFLSAAEKNYKSLVNGTLVGISGVKGRVPVKTLGDGMRRLLVIAMAMICANGGALILDEVDSGLHYSAMTSLWNFIINAARNGKVQVFASTHNLDCLRGLASVCEKSDPDIDEVRLYALSNIGKRVVAYSGREVAIAVNNEIEVRT